MTIQTFRDEKGDVVHACATGSFSLPKNHWIYVEPVQPQAITGVESEFCCKLRSKVRDSLKYTIQVCTLRGAESDFDPDAMLMTMEHTLFGELVGLVSDAMDQESTQK